MLLDLEALVVAHRLDVGEILHVGAHVGQEAETYEALGATSVTWIEANPAVLPDLRRHVEPLGHRVLAALATDRTGDIVDFHITNNQQSSSILRLGTHRYEHPEVVVTESVKLTTTTLDDLCASADVGRPNILVLDVQGAEMLVLRGATRVMSTADCIYAEVNERPLYAGATLLPEFDSFLASHGFDRVATALTVHGWGDALYVRKESVMSAASAERTPLKPGYDVARALRRRVGSRVRAVVSGAVDRRFDAVEAELGQMTHRMAIIEQMLVRGEQEIEALRQQVEECLDFLRIQHTVVREVLEEVKPLLGPRNPEQ